MFYKNLAPVYHHVFPVGQKKAFLSNCFKPKSKLLDIGCADGRVAAALADTANGYQITGIDLSSDLIQVAKTVTAAYEAIHIIELDMTAVGAVFPAESFDGVYCIGNTLVHLEDFEAISKTLAAFYKVLSHGGTLVLQLLNYDKILNERLEALPLIDNACVRFERRYQYVGDRITFASTLTLKDTSETLESSTQLFPLLQKPLLVAMKQMGFESIEVFSGFDASAFDSEKLPLVITAKKA